MASEVEICNMALAHLGASPIVSLDENRISAQRCKLFYPNCRNLTLRDHRWTFAQRRRALASMALPDEYIGKYSYAYALPSDCLKSHGVIESPVLAIEPTTTVEQPFEIARTATGEKIILANIQSAVLSYTMRVVDPTWFDDEFAAAVALKLASVLAVPLIKNKALGIRLENQYRISLLVGEASDANQQKPAPDITIPWIAARTEY